MRLTVRRISVCKAIWSGHNRKSCRAGNNNAVRAAAAMNDQKVSVCILAADNTDVYVCRVKYELVRLHVTP